MIDQNVDNAAIRKIMAQEHSVECSQFLSDFPNATWDDVRRFIRSYVIPDTDPWHPHYRVLLLMCQEGERYGIRPCDVENLYETLSFESSYKFTSLDFISVSAAMISPLEQGNAMPWSMLDSSYFLAPFQGDGGFMAITGRPRAMKPPSP